MINKITNFKIQKSIFVLKQYRIFIILLFTYFPLFKYYIELNNNKGHSFMTGDWLINYNYGFISRGLFGTLLINIFDSQEQLLDALSFVLISIYLLIFLLIVMITMTLLKN